MERQTLLTLTAVMAASTLFCFAHDGWAVAEVDWYGGQSPPSLDWLIYPPDATVDDIISFSGPTGVFSNDCFGDMAMGGQPMLTINSADRTVQLWFQGPAPDFCFTFWDPVCGLWGQFGPLAAGEWLFFCDGTTPDP